MGKDGEKKEKKAAITENDLKEKFKEQIGLMGQLNAKATELQNQTVQVQSMATKASGAAESAINMLAEIIGEEEATKFGQEVMNPKANGKQENKEVKKDG